MFFYDLELFKKTSMTPIVPAYLSRYVPDGSVDECSCTSTTWPLDVNTFSSRFTGVHMVTLFLNTVSVMWLKNKTTNQY